MKKIDLTRCNKAILYAPNGVMKTSLSKVFGDIARGQTTSDRIFKNLRSSYVVNYYATTYKQDNLLPTDSIYIVNSFEEKFELPKETMSTLLADEATRKKYDILMSEFSSEIKEFEANVSGMTGLTKPKVKGQLVLDFSLPASCDWPDIFEKLFISMQDYKNYSFFEGVRYVDLFNAKTIEIFKKPVFRNSIERYIEKLNELIEDNAILSQHFNDHNAEELGKALEKHNLFEAKHSILLKDGKTIVNNLPEWNRQVTEQLGEIYKKPELSKAFTELKNMLSKNVESNKLREIIINNRAIIPYLSAPDELCLQLWLYYMKSLEKDFDAYSEKVTSYANEIKSLYEQAAKQAERWNEIVSEFNRRFKVPFEIKIGNKANYLLKDEAPNLFFTYTRGNGAADEQKADYGKEELMPVLSMGERRAMYLLYILFDLERIQRLAISGAGKYLVIADDIVDSFDYKNKYAIIEYLNDLSKNSNIDLIILTHNFDFYRTVMSRLGVVRENCYIIYRNNDDTLVMGQFKYRNDFFSKIIVNSIKDGQMNSDEKIKLLFASIPFYRNLFEYMQKDDDYLKLTSFLHLKTIPLNTQTMKISDLWAVIQPIFGLSNLNIANDELYITTLKRIAAGINARHSDEIQLENKILISIAIRIETEIFLKNILVRNGHIGFESTGMQTREWSNLSVNYLSNKQKEIIDEVNLMTPESIHLNSFMYEPIIDMSDWMLNRLYDEVLQLDAL